ncbi:hypothetical protein [Mycobacterium sp. SMC-17]|uniref:hypothetical protein n=1 Tax=Mycobacterium sp. SMC-17 TaxID=3381628 RepID=UPI003876DD17
MTYPNPDGHRPTAPSYQPNHAAPQPRAAARSEEDLSFAMVAMLTFFGLTSRQDRLSDSTQKAMKVVLYGGLGFLVAFGALVVFTYAAHR